MPTVPIDAAEWPSAVQICRVNAATEVLPLVPVTAAMIVGLARIKLGGHQGERAPRILDPDERDAGGQRRIRRPLRDHRHRAGADRGADELQPVGLAARDGNEHVAGLDRAAVGRHAADIEIGGAMLALGVGRQDIA